jgi:transcriptional regulator with XRE-family HTH domain
MANYKKARIEAGIRPEKAAAELNVSITTLFSWERGDTSPTGPQIKALAKLYKRSADYLLGL